MISVFVSCEFTITKTRITKNVKPLKINFNL